MDRIGRLATIAAAVLSTSMPAAAQHDPAARRPQVVTKLGVDLDPTGDRTVTRRELVSVALAHLRLMDVGDEADVSLPDGVVTIRIQRVRRQEDGSVVLIGTVPGRKGSDVTLVVRADGLTGVVYVPGEGTFRLDTLADGSHALSDVDERQMGGCTDPPFAADGGGDDGGGGGAPPGGGDGPAADPCDAGDVIDVVILYTPLARAAAGGTAAIESEAQLAITMTNTAYANSAIPVQLDLVHLAETDYDESGTYSGHLTSLTYDNDGVMDEAHTLRDTYGGDLVALLVADDDYCGIAWIMSNPSGVWSQNYGFSVTTWNCAAGNLSFAHEIGHNIGCCHDPDNCSGGFHADSYGHRWTGDSATQWRSVMAYSPGWRVAHFSNPDVNFDGVATGIAGTRNNASTIATNAAVVANFRCSVSPEEIENVAAGSVGDQFGSAAANAGDVNNDGADDFIIGAPRAADNGVDSGSVFVYSGADSSVLYQFDGSAGDQFGYAVAAAGDYNNDGLGDVIIGAPEATDRNGYAEVRSGLDGSVLLRVDGSAAERLGYAVGGGEDVNSDGHDDVIIGAPHNAANGTKSGRAIVYSGSDSGVIAAKNGKRAGDKFGSAVALLGNVDGDAFADFAVGAPKFDPGAGSNAGRVYVYAGADGSRLYKINGVAGGDRFGSSIAAVGQVDGDGRTDFVVGSPYHTHDGLQNAGRVDVFSGQTGTIVWSKPGKKPGGRMGWSVDGTGDLDGDGADDVVYGVPRRPAAGMPEAGRVYLRSGASGSKLASFDGANSVDRFGAAVAGGIDFNDDDDFDIVAGAPRFDNGAPDTGYVYLIDPAVAQAGAPAGDPAYDEIGGDDQAPGDVNGDGVIDVLDIVAIITGWGACHGCPEDVNDSGVVDVDDVLSVLAGLT